MDQTATDPLVGDLLGDRYRITGRIARGGMATVYTAVDTRLERTVAIKIIHPSYAGNATFRSRFDREAKTIAGLTHPNVVAVYDSGQHRNLPYLVMEYVPGRTLRDVLGERGRLTPTEAVAVAEPVLAALAAAHRAGLVHRDVKPENILIDGPLTEPLVKVADFGLARAVEESAEDATGGQLMATVAYVPPELVRHGRVDARSDVYSAGIVLYELLTGSVPYRGKDATEVAYQHVECDVPAPSVAIGGLPPALDRLVVRATRRDPAARPADAGAMLAELRQVRAGDLTGRTVAHHTVALPQTRRPATESVEPVPRRRRPVRRSTLVALAAVVVLGLVAGIGGWWLGAGRYTQAPSLLAASRADALDRAQHKGFHVRWGPARFSETAPKDTVLSQDPQPGDRILAGGTITVVLSKGPERYRIPSLVGRDAGDAREKLEGMHLTVTTSQKYSTAVAEGQVVSVSPRAGTVVRRGAAVKLVVSRGPAPATVPDVRGMTVDDAQAELDDAQLQASVTEKTSTTVPEGEVISQSPAPDTGVDRDTTVKLVVSTGPPKVHLPDVTGEKYSDAKRRLERAGFVVRGLGIVRKDGRVRSQSPAGDSEAPKGSTITLVVI
ncbi:Stk1 family PASTA domain-containing Ser/Thr kinase [Actinocatenispora rupis]|uniref:non-specific serine/threonine protein kinase n=1 Tax=Actinocatenispora rupis TaxID=519421 RepID=A0A8J3JDK7_9ACTN|nr:Stk1 family PASTA domain-containing Ser/Thr kinase [Actinocatenispora rupis]GID14769.1 serine/threonine protein kinase [Actinocatenispora rupis]